MNVLNCLNSCLFANIKVFTYGAQVDCFSTLIIFLFRTFSVFKFWGLESVSGILHLKRIALISPKSFLSKGFYFQYYTCLLWLSSTLWSPIQIFAFIAPTGAVLSIFNQKGSPPTCIPKDFEQFIDGTVIWWSFSKWHSLTYHVHYSFNE